MKLFKKPLLALSLFSFLLFPSLTSCSSIQGGTNVVYAISSIATSKDADGNIILTISYTDTSVEPLSITIPVGISGEDGVGVSNVAYEYDEETGEVTLTISYTDEEKADTVVTIPAIPGLDGVGIESIVLGTPDEETNTTPLTFYYTDGTDYTINLPNPVGIEDIEWSTDPDTREVTITIHYTGDSKEDTVITIPAGVDGEDGVGVASIQYNETESTDTQIVITITYTNGDSTNITFDRPQATQWHYGTGAPTMATTAGDVGDYYIDTSNGYVYVKTSTRWAYLFSLRNEDEAAFNCSITFDPQGGSFSEEIAARDPTEPVLVTFEAGTYIRADMNTYGYDLDVFTPTYEGYIFNGWYTDSTASVNSAHFTNITVIPRISSLTLYANWVEDPDYVPSSESTSESDETSSSEDSSVEA